MFGLVYIIIFQSYHGGHFIVEGNRCTRMKLPTCRK